MKPSLKLFQRPRDPISLVRWIIVGLVMMAANSMADTKQVDSRQSAHDGEFWVEQIADGLRYPSAMVWLPNCDLLIAERQGGLRIFRNGALLEERIRGVPPSFQNVLDGLKDVVLDPEFKTNSTLYILMSEGTYESHHVAVYRATYHGDTLRGAERIFRSRDKISGSTSPAVGRMLLLPDKTLLVGTGESVKDFPQKLDSHLGKTLRINRDGSIPPDNPFATDPHALPEIWTSGHRSPTGLYWDRETNAVWEVEAGPRGGDELNLLTPGRNYGWPLVTWGFDYSGVPVSSKQFEAGLEDAVHIWTPSVTPAGITRYRGHAYPQWDGDFFVGYLSGKALARLRIVDGKVVLQERLVLDLEERMRDIRTGPDGYLYLLTDHPNGRLLRLMPGRPQADQMSRVARKLQMPPYNPSGEALMPGDPLKGKQAFLEQCSSCHSIGSVVQGGQIGPDLAGVYGRKAGIKPGYSYSAAMKEFGLIWDFVSLNFLISDPGTYVPGTLMAAPPVMDTDMRRDIVGFLKQTSEATH